ncbi:tail fiber protein [uncultured Deinococcus sp.]|uniref:phage tail protein n=1 Tax=uncultured Deinococcus sp. TaxID=158789 RepID=UPI002586E5B9|nr:tail fiber protein [uncultured Deinococcus sp.]
MDNFIGEIRLAGFGFPPKGWALCNGQLLPVNQNQALFSLLGTAYGGNGITTFGLPNLQTRVPLGMGQQGGVNYPWGQAGGEATHALTTAEMPAHTHALTGSAGGATALGPANNLLATPAAGALYGAGTDVSLASSSVGPSGSGQPHQNMPPYLVINYIIALVGIYPSRS